MRGYYWSPQRGEWYWRENQGAENWHGPYPNRTAAKVERRKFTDNQAPKLFVSIGGS